MNVETFLKNRGINFEVLPHRTTHTASRTAQILHVPGRSFAKTVVLHVDGRTMLAVVPADRFDDMNMVRREFHVADVHITEERAW